MSAMQTLNRNGVKLAYREAGHGAPPIVLIHGIACEHGSMARQFEHYRGAHRVVSVDFRGHGESDKPAGDYTLDQYVGDVVWMLRELGVYKPVIVGHSLGGVIALALAAKEPDVPAGIVMLGSPVVFPEGMKQAVAPLTAGLHSPGYLQTMRAFMASNIGESMEAEEKARFLDGMGNVPGYVMASTWDSVLASDSDGFAAACRVPALYIHSDTHYSDLARFRRLCPQLQVGQTVGEGHWHHLSAADQVNAMIDRFLTEIPQPVGGAGMSTSMRGQMRGQIRGEASIVIDAPVHPVYEFLADLGRHSEWSVNVYKVTKVTPPGRAPVEGVGAVYQTSEGPPPLPVWLKAKMMFFFVVGLIYGVKPYSEAEITALEVDRRVAWKARLSGKRGEFNRAVWEIALEPQGGGTLATQRFEYSPQHWAARGMIGKAENIERSVAANLANLKRVLEERPAVASAGEQVSGQSAA